MNKQNLKCLFGFHKLYWTYEKSKEAWKKYGLRRLQPILQCKNCNYRKPDLSMWFFTNERNILEKYCKKLNKKKINII